jgi:decaprenylphospho-beta-D-ribofuranose 2-oxidase
MSVTERLAPVAPKGCERTLSGWGRTTASRCFVRRPVRVEEVAELLASGRGAGGAIARGAGRSYGDAAQNAHGLVLDMTGRREILGVDRAARLVRAQAGATIGALLARLAAHGLTLPVVPGTRHVTLAGAIASDIHGKNHHRDGAFARHVADLTLCTPAGDLLRVAPDADGELFAATLGGMGLTGVIVEATVRAEPLPSPWVTADVDRTDGLKQTLELLGGEERHRYSVAWLDLLAAGPSFGRAVVSRADPLPAERAVPSGRALRQGRSYPRGLAGGPPLAVPAALPAGVLHPAAVRAFNELHWRAGPRRVRGRPLALAPYFFPLDVVGDWNRLYGPAGLIQHQFVIPAGEENALERAFALMRERHLPVYLAVFKRFGGASGGPLSFPMEGWTLAIDVPAGADGVAATLDALDEIVAGCGGRVYLSKDARLRAELLPVMYPQLERLDGVRSRVDPDEVLRSDLARRLGLCA